MSIRNSVAVFALVLVLLVGATAARAQGSSRVEAILEEATNDLVRMSDSHWHQGEYNHVLNLNQMVITSDPGNVDAYANSGWLLWSMDRDTEAVAVLERGARNNPNSFFMLDELGQYYFIRKKDFSRAASYYEKAAQKKDCPVATLHMLAHSYEKSNQMPKALAVWKKAAARPGNDAGKRNLKRLQRQMAGQR